MPAISFQPFLQNAKMRYATGIHAHALSASKSAYAPLMDTVDFNRIKEAKIKTVRTDLLWGAVEKQPGQFNFDAYQHFVNELKSRKLQPMMVLGLGNRLYSPNLSIHPPAAKAAFEDYAKAAVQHFKGQGIIWELVQQPNQKFFWHPGKNPKEYTDLALKLLPQLKALDPEARFVAPSLAGHDLAYQEDCYKAGLLQHVDAVSVHPYRTHNRPPETIIENFQKSQALIEKYKPAGKKIPLILGEWGYHRLEISPEKQADYAVRQFLTGQMLGSPINNWHIWKGDIVKVDDTSLDPDQHFGFVNKAIQPFPVLKAVEKMHQALKGQAYAERLDSEPDDFLLAFEGKGKNTLAVWTTQKSFTIDVQGQQYVLNGTPKFIPLT